MTKPKAAKLTDQPVSLRVHRDLLTEADALAEVLAEDAELVTTAGGMNRSAVLRLALVEGLKVLRRKHKG